MKIILLVLSILIAIPAFSQQDTVLITTPEDTLKVTERLNDKQLKQFYHTKKSGYLYWEGHPTIPRLLWVLAELC